MGGPAGRLAVGEYVGHLAAQAAQAVRRAGLRPGLDRSFGCSPKLLGQVVAQEPPAGSELARNGLVTLYVAAPSVPQAEENDVGDVEEHPPFEEPADAPSEQDTLEWDLPSPAEPVCSDEEGQHEESGEQWADGELTDEELVAQVDDLFAGRVTSGRGGWRRAYPPRSTRGVRARLAEHPWLIRAVGGMLAAWAVVGGAAALAGHPTSTKHAHVASTVAQRAATQTTSSPQAPYALTVRTVRPRAIPARTHHRPRARRARRHRPRQVAPPAPVTRVVAPEEPARAPVPAVTQPARSTTQGQSGAEVHAAVEFGPER
jgi:hypothetical protein